MGELMTPAELWAWIQANGSGLIVPVGAVLAVVLGLLLVRQVRTSGVADVGRSITVPLVLAWEAQGLHQLAVATGVSGPSAWVLALVTSAVLITLTAFADKHHREHGNLGIAGRLVWVVAVPMGLVVAFTARTVAEFGLRIVLPLLVAIVWWVRYAPPIVDGADPAAPNRRRGSWRWTPRRLGVQLGLIDPTDMDIDQVHEERQIRRLTTVSHKLHHGVRPLRALRAARLRRLGLLATPEMIEEVARRVHLVHRIEHLTDPDQYEAGLVAPNRRDQTGDGRTEEAPAARHADSVPPSPRRGGNRRAIDPIEEQDRAAAREAYRVSLTTAQPLTASAIARQFNRPTNPKWGAARIAEVREGIVSDTGEFPIFREEVSQS